MRAARSSNVRPSSVSATAVRPAPPRAVPLPATTAPSRVSARTPPSEWEALFGTHWRVLLLVALALIWALGATVPLGDADLGMHLRVGEWVVTHRGLPRTEPFAWTRAGAPYLAYSWLAEASYYLLWRAGGAWALQALNGVVMLAAALAVGWFARLARHSVWTTTMLIVLHTFVVGVCAGALRPQGLLAVVLPLCWAAAARLRADAEADGETGAGARWPYALLVGATAVAANTHLFAPASAAALALVVPTGRTPSEWRRFAAAAAAVGVGLLCTPYVLEWPAIYRLYVFTPTPLLRFPSPIAELTPGVVDLTREFTGASVIAPALAVLPWLAPRRSDRALVPAAAPAALLWLAGLFFFALAVRGVFLWWLVCLPLVAAALARVPAPTASVVGRVLRIAPLAYFGVWTVGSVRDTARVLGSGEGRDARWLPNRAARGAFLLADSLDRLVPGGGGRVVTTFTFGNALLWRLPRYSMSIDGRAVFPDSATALEAWAAGWSRPDTLRAPLGGADLALLPAGHTALAQVARTPGWERLARVQPAHAARGDTAEVWVRTAWLRVQRPR